MNTRPNSYTLTYALYDKCDKFLEIMKAGTFLTYYRVLYYSYSKQLTKYSNNIMTK